jgi:hypothetical protein
MVDMPEVEIGGQAYRIATAERDGRWTATAVRADTGSPFGVECTGATRVDAAERLTSWLQWQHEHSEALAALQIAERAYHRTISGSAFASPTEGPSSLELQKESLERVEAARIRLDEVRARRPQ